MWQLAPQSESSCFFETALQAYYTCNEMPRAVIWITGPARAETPVPVPVHFLTTGPRRGFTDVTEPSALCEAW